jgi:hypothetical protein
MCKYDKIYVRQNMTKYMSRQVKEYLGTKTLSHACSANVNT